MTHSILEMLACLVALASCSCQVIISQVGEGSVQKKFAVIQNRGNAPVDIGGWKLSDKTNVESSNSSPTVRKTWPVGSLLASGATFTLCNGGGFSPAFAAAFCDDEITLQINGNDALILALPDGSIVDQFGDLDGAQLRASRVATWTISCTQGGSRNHMVLRRTCAAAVSTNTDWAASSGRDWDVYPLDTYISNGIIYSTDTAEASPTSAPLECPGVTASPLATLGTTAGSNCSTTDPSTNSTTTATDPAPDVTTGGDTGGPAVDISCAAPQQQEDRRSDKNRLVIATFNTEFLFDGVDDPNPSRFKGDSEGARAHTIEVAKSINDWDVDIIALVEVEDCSIMSTLVSELDKASPSFTGYIVPGVDSATGQNVALLTKIDPSETLTRTQEREDYPIPGSKCGFKGQRTTGISKNFIAKFNNITLGDKQLNIAMVGLHFKAFPTDKASCSKREGQATIARRAINDLWNQGYEVIALGDLNDYDADILDAVNSKPRSSVLSILKGPGLDMFNVMADLPKRKRYSAWYDKNRNDVDDGIRGGENTMIDHILVSSGIRALMTDVRIDHSEAASTGLSDHWPIIITLQASAAERGVCEDSVCPANR